MDDAPTQPAHALALHQASPSPLPPSGDGRDAASGRFVAGNRLGRGNPHAAHVARLREAMLGAVTDADLCAIVLAMIQKAKAGDVAAAALVLDRTIGKPAQPIAVEPHDGPRLIRVEHERLG